MIISPVHMGGDLALSLGGGKNHFSEIVQEKFPNDLFLENIFCFSAQNFLRLF